MMGITEITAPQNTEVPYDYNYGFTLEKEQQFFHYIKTGNIEIAQDIVCTIFDTILNQQQPPMQIIQCFIFDIVATIIKTVPITNNAQDLNHEKEIDFINQLMNSTTVAQMQEVLLSMISSICPTGLITDIMEYIEQNYIEEIISMVGYTNRATFSRFFKKFEGITAGKYREIHSK